MPEKIYIVLYEAVLSKKCLLPKHRLAKHSSSCLGLILGDPPPFSTPPPFPLLIYDQSLIYLCNPFSGKGPLKLAPAGVWVWRWSHLQLASLERQWDPFPVNGLGVKGTQEGRFIINVVTLYCIFIVLTTADCITC